MSAIINNETLKPEAGFDQLSSEPDLVQQSFASPFAPTAAVSSQSTVGNASVANAEVMPAPLNVASEPSRLQSAYGNAAVANATAQPSITPPETALESPLETAPEPGPVSQSAYTLPESEPEKYEAKVSEKKKPTGAESQALPSEATTPPVTEPVKKRDEIAQSKAQPPEPVAEAKAEAKPEKAAQKIKTAGGTDKEKKEGKAEEAGKGAGTAATTEAAPAGGGEGGGKEAKPADVKIKPGDPGEMLTSLGEVPPSQAVLGLKSLRGASAAEFTREHQELAEHPPTMARPSGLPRKPAEEKEEGVEEEAPEELVCEEAEPEEQTRIETETPPIKEPLPVPSWIANVLDEAPEEDFATLAWRSLLETPVTDENVDTNAGPRPTVDLTGEADPQQMSTQVSTNRATFDAEKIKAAEEAAQDWGENDIFPVVPEEDLIAQMKVKAARRTKGQAQSPKGIPADGLAAFDQAAAEQWSTAITDAQAENAQAAEERSDRETSAHNRTAKEIAALESGTVDQQTNTQLQAQKDVSDSRVAWSDELAAADTAYTKKQTDLETQARKDINLKKTEADEGAKAKLDAAEIDAALKKQKAEEDAAKERAKAKKSSGGFFGWLKSKAKALINAIRSAVNFIFDQLRKAVKWVIDQAKKAAMWLIDKARDAIVGLIHAFGAALELAADVFLFAFPKTRKKVKSYIRSGVATAEDAVNYAADVLKEKVCAALDALGAALDYVLELYQKAYNAILDAVEFIIIKLIEILEGIARLAESASMVGDYFIGQVQEEGIGMDLTQPLPIEKLPKPANATTSADAAIAAGVNPADASVLKKSTLENSDVEMSNVAELYLEPELLASLPPMQEGQEYHFGLNDKPENERDFVLNDAANSATGGFTPATTTTESGNGAAPTPAPATPDVANMTPDQQLEYLENQEMPHTCGGQKEEEPAKSDAVPDHMRIYGPFTSGQRFSYMWGQIKKGISQWWECNKVKIIIAFAVAALITLLLAVLTGGAIFAAIPPLLTIIAAILIGVAIVRAASYIGDFIKLAWGGDLQGGAKALARGFAILVIELVFALLFNLGSIIKVIKSGLKATAKAAAGAAKTFVKTTAKAAQELGAVSKTIVTAGLKNSKLIIQGFKNGFGEGIKTIKQLTAELLSKSRFRGFFFRLRSGYMELWGRFNPEVLLGKKKITKTEAEKHLQDIAKAGEKLAAGTRTEAENIAKAVGKAAEEGLEELPKTLQKRVKKFFAQFKGQHVDDNPILAEVWERALKRIADGESKFAQYFENGVLKSGLSDDVMKQLYAKARGEMDTALKSVVEELEKGFKKQLTNRITELPERVQVHHLLYKSIFPQLAVARSNLILALRKTGGSLDELHDLFHLMSAGGTGNRWKTLLDQMSDLITEIYKL